jgi:hypothetical protein
MQATGGMSMSGCTGTVQELLALMSVGGIDKAAMMNMTPVADMREAALAAGKGTPQEVAAQMIERMKRRNDWSCRTAREQPSLVAFIGLDPTMGPEDAVAEVHRCRDQGAVGIKLHPSSQRHNPGDPNLWPAYAEAEALEMPVLSHGGVFPVDPESSEFSRPRAFGVRSRSRRRFVLAPAGQGYVDEALAMIERFNCTSIAPAWITGTVMTPDFDDEAGPGDASGRSASSSAPTGRVPSPRPERSKHWPCRPERRPFWGKPPGAVMGPKYSQLGRKRDARRQLQVDAAFAGQLLSKPQHE